MANTQTTTNRRLNYVSQNTARMADIDKAQLRFWFNQTVFEYVFFTCFFCLLTICVIVLVGMGMGDLFLSLFMFGGVA